MPGNTRKDVSKRNNHPRNPRNSRGFHVRSNDAGKHLENGRRPPGPPETVATVADQAGGHFSVHEQKEQEKKSTEVLMQMVSNIKLDESLGVFRLLPRELLYVLLDWLSVHQLCKLSLTTKMLSSEIRRYILMGSARKRFTNECSANNEKLHLQNIIEIDPFQTWGMLLKTTTIIMNSKKRCLFLASFFDKNNNITDWFGWGRCFMAFAKKWDFTECEGLMHAVLRFSGVNQMLSQVLPEEPGKYPSLEIEIRERIEGFFLNHLKRNERDQGFWISAILRSQNTISYQGRLFMIIFGPIRITGSGQKIIDWDVLCDGSSDLHHLCLRFLGPIALGLHHLYRTADLGIYTWNHDQVFNLMEEITTSPHSWTFENFASLLALRPQMIHIALYTRVKKGHVQEATLIFYAVKCVFVQWGTFVNETVSNIMLRTFQELPVIDRRIFLSSLMKAESRELSRLLLDVPFDREKFHAEVTTSRSLSALMRTLARTV